MPKGPPGSGAQIASQSLFAASSAANAIPVAGQFVSAGLAIAGLFTKIFGGRRRKKKEEARREHESRMNLAKSTANTQVQSDAAGGIGLAGQGGAAPTAPVVMPSSPTFSSYGGGAAPSVQPVQQVLTNSVFKQR